MLPWLAMLAATAPPAPSNADGLTLAADIARVGSGHATVMSYDIDKTGKVTQCNVVQSSGSTELDQRACAIFLEKARFRPARDEAGHPIAKLDQRTRIVWNITE